MLKKQHINVFISSTSIDLEAHRNAVRDLVLAFGFYPIMMEYFPAMDADSVQLCMNKVDEAEIYVGIFAHRYGFCPQNSTISITEMEFDRATTRKVPRLCFLIDERAPWPEDLIESEPGSSKLKAFKKRLDTSVVRQTFITPESLALEVSKALQPFIKQQEPPVKETPSYSWEDVSNLADRYTFRSLGGRYKETFERSFYAPRPVPEDHLNRFLESDKAVAVITGKAGMGKSNLLCHFIEVLQKDHHLVFLEDCNQQGKPDIFPSGEDLIDFWANQFYMSQNPPPTEKIILILDGLNENSDPISLLGRLSKNLLENKVPFVKIVIVCRYPSWRFLSDSLQIPNQLIYQPSPLKIEIEVEAFNDAEVQVAYEKYFRQLGLLQLFSDLSQQVRDFIKNPLFLGLVMKTYGVERSQLPENISLREIFDRYIENSLGSSEKNNPRVLIIDRMLDYLYQLKQRALDVGVLQQDSVVGHYVLSAERLNPFTELLDTGLITQEIKVVGVRRKSEQIYVTYERIFEYLLADLVLDSTLVITQSDIELIIQLAIQNVFSPLLGALELALSFRIIDHPDQRYLALQLTEDDKPYSRQLLIDVLFTIRNERRDLAEQIIHEMSTSPNINSRLTACLVAYQLRFTKHLIALAKSRETTLSHLASFYIYRLWDENRRQSNLDDAYKIVNNLAIDARFPNVLRDQRAMFALLSVSAHMLRHLLDDPDQLNTLGEIVGSVVRTLPGVRQESVLRGILNQISGVVAVLGFQLVGAIAMRPGIIFANRKVMQSFFKDNRNHIILLEQFSNYTEYPSLVGYQDELAELMNRPHPIIPWIVAGILIFHTLKAPNDHLLVLDDIFQHGNFATRFWVTYALIAVGVIRLSRFQNVSSEFLDYVYTYGLAMWRDRHNPDSKLIATGEETDIGQSLLLLEAIQQQVSGSKLQSRFVSSVLSDTDNILASDDVNQILGYLKFLGYQGYPKAMLQILFSDFQPYWEKHEPELALKLVTMIRALYREEVDTFFMSRVQLKQYWDIVCKMSSIPDIYTIWYANAQLWILGLFGNNTTLKIAYLILHALTSARSTNDFLRNAVKAVLGILKEPHILDELFVQMRLKYNPTWDKYEMWDIPKELFERIQLEAQH